MKEIIIYNTTSKTKQISEKNNNITIISMTLHNNTYI